MKNSTLTLFCFLLVLFFTTPCQAKDTVGFLIPSSGLGDQSFNDMTYSGIIQAKTRHNFDLIREQCTNFTEDSRQAALVKLITRGADIVVVNGWEYRNVVDKYAKMYPQRTFLINDLEMTGYPNVISTVFGQQEGSFLAGALAGWMSKSGKIGFIGGMDIPVIRSFQSGFQEGARFTNPQIEISEVFLSTLQDTFSGFDSPGRAFTIASRMYEGGVDIIFGAAGLSGNGIIQAARRQQKFVIGVDADQDHMAEGYVLTSVMKRLDKVTATILDQIFSGESLHGVYHFNVKKGGISLSPMTYTRHIIPQEIHDKLSQLQQQIINGEITINNPGQGSTTSAPTVSPANQK